MKKLLVILFIVAVVIVSVACVEQHVHTFGEWQVTKSATCSAEGIRERVCECGEKETETIAKTGHVFGDWLIVTSATCSTEGVRERVCECGIKESETIAILDHEFGDWQTSDTHHWKECKNGGETKEYQEHTFGEWTTITTPDCVNKGKDERVCTVCGMADVKYTDELGHIPVIDEAIPATCTSRGYSEGSHCSCCNETIVKQRLISMLGHDWLEYISNNDATCQADGTKTATCSRCTATKTSVDKGTKLASCVSSEDYFYDNISKYKACIYCNAKLEEIYHEYNSDDKCVNCDYVFVQNEGIEYVLSDDNNSYYVYGIGTCKDNNIYIPPYYNHLPVVGVSEYAFDGLSQITEIVLPDMVETIGSYAFRNCIGISSFSFPKNLSIIGQNAFEGCSNLNEIVLPDTVETIGSYAFRNCIGISSFSFPKNLSIIEQSTFEGCSNLNKIVLPDTIETIGAYAFRNCIGITSLSFPINLSTIGRSAFEGCSNLNEIVLFEKVKRIEQNAFKDCVRVKLISISSSIEVGNDAFINCSDKQKVVKIASTDVWDKMTFGNENSLPTKNAILIKFGDKTMSQISEWVVSEGTTALSAYLFSGFSKLKSIVIPNTVTTIGACVFMNCTSLESLDIPNSVTAIGYRAFGNCTSLESLDIPNSVTAIGYRAFGNCTSLVSLDIPVSVEKLGSEVLFGCGNIKSLGLPFLDNHLGWLFGTKSYSSSVYIYKYYIPENLSNIIVKGGNISEFAFQDCDMLKNVEIGDAVESMYSTSFSGTNLVTYERGAYFLKDWLLYVDKGLTAIKVKSGTKHIAINAFYPSRNTVESITIPDSVITIGSGAFSDCSLLESITLPFVGAKANVTSNDTYQYPFGYIFGTRSYTGAVATSQYYYEDSTSSTTSTTYYIPSSLKSVTITGGNILYGAFYNCTSLTNVTIGNEVTSIGSSSFYGCSSLTDVTVPDSVTSIGEKAFSGCSRLTSVTVPDSVTSIGEKAFSGCSRLTSVTVPDRVTSIGSGSFSGCSSLESITLPFVGAKANVTSNDTYQYPFGYIFGTRSYTGAVETSQYYYEDSTSSITSTTYYIPSSLKSVTITGGNILYGAFYNCTSLTNVTIGNEVTSIGKSAFYNCTSLTNVTIGNSVTSIGQHAFRNCTSLTNVTVPDGVTIIVDDTFNGCTGLTNVTIGNGVTSIGWGAFSGCSSLMDVTIPNSVTSIGNVAFSGCSGLMSVTIGNRVTSIGSSAFNGCSSLTNVTIPDSVTEIGYKAFSGCSGLTNVTIGNGVTSTGESSFSECSSLTNVTIRNGVTIIGESSFFECSSLTNVTIPDSVYKIGSYAFKSCSDLTSVTIGRSVTSIGYDAFEDCLRLVEIYNKSSLKLTRGSSYGYIGYYAKNIYTTEGGSKLTTDTNGFVIYIEGNKKSLIAYHGSETDIVLPDGITDINQNAFRQCKGLTSITIPDSVTRIDFYAFYYCLATYIYYYGATEQWNNIDIVDQSQSVERALYFYSEAKPTVSGNYWHYDTDGITKKKYGKILRRMKKCRMN